MTKLQSKRDAANTSPSQLFGFSLAPCWRWRSLRASVHQRGTSIIARKLFTTSSSSACSASGTQWIEHFKLTDVLESGRLCIRLRPGFIDQVLEGGGFVMVRGRRALLLLNLDTTKIRAKRVECWPRGVVVQSRFHFRPRSLAQPAAPGRLHGPPAW